MKNRCYYQRNPNYADYGGRGIRVCDEWRNSFAEFYKWAMASGYDDSLSLDRIDNNGDYCPSNCKWSTRIEQANNKRNNRFVEIDGVAMTITQWAKASGVPQQTISYRYHKGVRGAALIASPEAICSANGKKGAKIKKLHKEI